MLLPPEEGSPMDGLEIQLEEEEHRLVLRLTGTLDGRTALAVSASRLDGLLALLRSKPEVPEHPCLVSTEPPERHGSVP